MVDAVVLGATEVDRQLQRQRRTPTPTASSCTGSGAGRTACSSKCTILAVPSFRDRIPVILDRVTTVCGPGELIDVVATERGLAINPLRTDLLDAMRGSDVPRVTLPELKAEVERLCGGAPAKPELGEEFVAAIKWVDGTVIDGVRRVVE